MNASSPNVASPEEVFEWVQTALESTKSSSQAPERRISRREVAYLPVEIFLVGENEATLPYCTAVTRDISFGGLGIISPRPLDDSQAVVKFSNADIRSLPLLIDVLYCNAVGPFYFLGTRFCADWTSP